MSTQESIKSKVVTPSGESQLLELMNILKVQQNQLEENQKQLQKLSDQVLKSKSDTDDKIFKKKQRPKIKNFHLTCYRCGGKGHKAPDCSTQLQDDNDSQGKGKSKNSTTNPLNEKRPL